MASQLLNERGHERLPVCHHAYVRLATEERGAAVVVDCQHRARALYPHRVVKVAPHADADVDARSDGASRQPHLPLARHPPRLHHVPGADEVCAQQRPQFLQFRDVLGPADAHPDAYDRPRLVQSGRVVVRRGAELHSCQAVTRYSRSPDGLYRDAPGWI